MIRGSTVLPNDRFWHCAVVLYTGDSEVERQADVKKGHERGCELMKESVRKVDVMGNRNTLFALGKPELDKPPS